MNWLYAVRQKAQVAFLLAIILLGIFFKNVIDRRNVSELGDSFSSVYKDRLVVESYIYKLAEHLYKKQMLIDQCSQQSDTYTLKTEIYQHNLAIHSLIQEYEKTKLTHHESACFESFKQNVREIISIENQYLERISGNDSATAYLDQQFLSAARNLDQLSAIQIEEGKTMTDQSKQIVAGSSILSQFELAMIIVIGLIIQALIFASNSLTPKQVQKHQLN